MREYKYDEESVNALIEWSKAASFPEQIQLNDAETIFDVKRYVQANLSDITAHYPDEFYNPAITRMYRLKDKMEGKDDAELRILPPYPSTDTSVALYGNRLIVSSLPLNKSTAWYRSICGICRKSKAWEGILIARSADI